METENIDISELIKSRLEYLQKLVELRQLEVITQFDGAFVVNINPVLAEILINNLLSNALKHNIEHGSILIVAGNDENGALKNRQISEKYRNKRIFVENIK